jgi:hypothetical protein
MMAMTTRPAPPEGHLPKRDGNCRGIPAGLRQNPDRQSHVGRIVGAGHDSNYGVPGFVFAELLLLRGVDGEVDVSVGMDRIICGPKASARLQVYPKVERQFQVSCDTGQLSIPDHPVPIKHVGIVLITLRIVVRQGWKAACRQKCPSRCGQVFPSSYVNFVCSFPDWFMLCRC